MPALRRRRAATPIRPVRTSSLIPCGRHELLERVDLLGRAGRARSTTASAPTSSDARRRRPRPCAISSARRSGGALHLDERAARARRPRPARARSRGARSRACASASRSARASAASQSTRSVMHETSGRSVGPTARLLDVEAAPREHGRDPRQRARLVLDERRRACASRRLRLLARRRCTRPCRARPRRRGSSGSTARRGSTRQSTTAVRPQRERLARARPRARPRSSTMHADAAVRLGELGVVRAPACVRCDVRAALRRRTCPATA